MNQSIIIVIDGNIGVGKSKVINTLKTFFEKNEKICFLDEPLTDWLNFKDENEKNILQLYYEDNKKYGFLFQLLALITRFQKFEKVLKNPENDKKIIITERSILSDKEVFKNILIDENKISFVESKIYEIYHSKFYENLNEDLFIFLNCSSEESLRRIKNRGRVEEQSIPLEYLNLCKEKYLNMFDKIPNKKIKIDTETNFDEYFNSIVELINNYL